MCRLTLKQISRMRYLIKEEYSVEEVARMLGITKSTVYRYTKQERQKV